MNLDTIRQLLEALEADGLPFRGAMSEFDILDSNQVYEDDGHSPVLANFLTHAPYAIRYLLDHFDRLRLPRRVDVLDQGWVELQDIMGNDLAIVQAARTSHLGESKGPEKDKKLLFYLFEHKHHSPIEMCEMKFRLHAPEVVWRQLLRHRTANANLQSYRYMEAEADEFYLPTDWRLQAKANKQASEGLLDAAQAELLTAALKAHVEAAYALYKEALAKGVAREQARLFLPAFGLYSTGVVKFDVRNLLHFLALRRAPDAQFEIRQYAEAMWGFVVEAFPWCAEAFERFGGL